jgi:hypothetical protein
MNGENAANSFFVLFKTERQIDLLRYARAVSAGIELFHFYDRNDDFFGGFFRPRLPADFFVCKPSSSLSAMVQTPHSCQPSQ